ncbi:hypothetical protein [Streptomyces sp. NPDC018059]|uniref:hypothetical protein n=1 Tax=Streptomyces sp. NPDC018059 TaxID=3365041 RepID=UPI0037B8CA9D
MTDRDEEQSAAPLRQLPWTSPEGKPCYLDTDDSQSLLSRLADDVEEAQLSSARDVLLGSEAVLADVAAGERAVRFALTRTTESLRETLRIAHSRGARIQS